MSDDEFIDAFKAGFLGSMRNSKRFKSLEKEGMMDCEHMKTPDGVEVLIRKAENGFVVEVDYPRRMIPNPQMDKVKTLFSSITKGMGPDAEHDHTAFMKTIGDTISGLARPDKPLRKAHEEYVFQSMEAMMAFIKETIESADAAENAPAQK